MFLLSSLEPFSWHDMKYAKSNEPTLNMGTPLYLKSPSELIMLFREFCKIFPVVGLIFPGFHSPGYDVSIKVRKKIDREFFKNVIQKYYALRGWNEKGIPTDETIKKYGL